MKQVLQNVRTGELRVADVPCPQVSANSVLIATHASVISAGTERMLVEFSKASLLQKARQKPEQVKFVLNYMKTNGILPTLEAVFRKLDEPLPLGYCNAGVVVETGRNVTDLHPGDRVVSNGPHAEIVCVPRNLCARIPEGVTDEDAAFTVLGSIALQGIRLAAPTLGERFVVVGLGLVGLLTAQLLRASGCAVLGTDVDEARLELARSFGIDALNVGTGADPIAAAQSWTAGVGVDGVIITASSTSNDIVHQAAASCRKRGRIVLVGVVGLELNRADFYDKELSFQVSCSYGPGRYDEAYEQQGHDYPLGFVRWTEQRNFDAVLHALRDGRIAVKPLITDRVAIADAATAYARLSGAGGAASLGIVLTYPAEPNLMPRVVLKAPPATPAGKAVIGMIGAGNFTNAVLMPTLARLGARLAAVASRGGVSAQRLAEKYEADQAVTDYRLILEDPAVNAVVVALQHNLHADCVRAALEAGKHVFVEKPLCLNEDELGRIAEALGAVPAGTETPVSIPEAPGTQPLLMVGFNRRFSPHTLKIKSLLGERAEPLCMTMTVNAGAIPASHWTQDPQRGGGRIIGEGCHFIDLLACLADSPITSVGAACVARDVAVREDKMSILMTFADGSIGTVHYLANGNSAYPKERLEVFNQGRTLVLDNFRVTYGYGFKGFTKFKTARQDKGHTEELRRFIAAVEQGGESPTPFATLANVTRASFAAVKAATDGRVIELG